VADLERLGDRAIRFPRPAASARAIVRAVRGWPGVIDVVVAQRDVGVYFADTPRIDPARIRALDSLDEVAEPARDVALRAVYDGPDLADVAQAANLSVDEVVRIHADGTYVVDTMGFAPGFAYMRGLDARLELPRRATPRTRVPGGSIAIAGAHTAVYPFDSPGGWHLIGRVVDGPMFGAAGPRLALGDRVRFSR
jgi:KipI family sensor histidine kinase inhibitor